MKRLLLILLFTSSCCMTIRSQSPAVSFRNLGINDGLSQSSVVSVAMDKAGFIWLATQDGLNRYDGSVFEITRRNFDDITLPTMSRLGRISSCQDGALWMLTSGGRLEKLDLYTGRIRPLLPPDGDSLPPVTAFCQDEQGDLWIGTEEQGLLHYQARSGSLTHIPLSGTAPLPIIQSVSQDQQGGIWVLTNQAPYLYQPATGQWHSFPVKTSTGTQEPVSCSSVVQDKQGNYWLGSFGSGLFFRCPGDSAFRPFRSGTRGLPAGLVIEALLADRDGNIWIGTYGNGLYILSADRNNTAHYIADIRDPFAIAYDDILCIYEDPAGGIWIGTDGGGVSHYDKRLNNFMLLSKNNVPGHAAIEQIRSITTGPDNGWWFGTSNSGLTYAHPQKNHWFTLHFPPYNDQINNYDRIVSLLTDRTGDIWVGTQGNGLLIIDPLTGSIRQRFFPEAPHPRAIPDHTIWCLLPDSGQQVWIGTRNAGLCLISKQSGLLRHFTAGGSSSSGTPGGANPGMLPENNIRTLTRIDDSTICIGFEKKGLRLFNTRRHTLTDLPGSSGIQDNKDAPLKCAWYHPPILWTGMLSNGVTARNIRSGESWTIREEQGLPNNTIYGILPDQQGNLWMSSNKGIFRFRPPADLAATDRTCFSLFTAEDGLQSNEFNTGAGYRSPDGRLFFGGIRGLTILDPSGLEEVSRPAQVAITGIMVNNRPLQRDSSYPFLKDLRLTYDSNSFSCNFSAMDFAAPGRFNYYYQLVGYDEGWIDAGSRNYAAYTNLQPGRYLFRVKASRHLSGNEDPITTLSIRITPPFWQTWWFRCILIGTILGLVFLLYQYRIRQLLRVQQIRHRIASDLHDDIGSTLTNISMLSELGRKNLRRREEVELFLNRIGEEVQHSSQALDDIVWSININNDTIEQTVARMRRYVAELFEAANIGYTIQLDDNLGKKKLNMEQRRDFFLVFKEVINNISKHADATNVFIRVWLDKQYLFLEVRDDGKGFDPRSVTHRNGIKNMNNRIRKWKGSIRFESAPGQGSQILVQLPVLSGDHSGPPLNE